MKIKKLLSIILSVVMLFSVLGAYSNVYAASLTKTSITKIEAKAAGFKIKIKKASGVSGYQIQYATNSKFTSSKKVKTTSASKSITNIKAKKKYYVRVRTYKKTSKGTKYSAWSKSKTVTTKAKTTSASKTVYITATGSCYHCKICGKGNYYKVSLKEAKNQGLKPCSKCY